MEEMEAKAKPVGGVASIPPPASHEDGELKSTARFLWAVCQAWLGTNTPRLGAALAYYTIFAVAPLFLLAISLAGLWSGADHARDQLLGQVQQLIGEDGAQAIKILVTNAANQPRTSLWATLAAVGTLAVGATAVFVELQNDLNTIWGVQRAAGTGLRNFIKDRMLSFAMILGIGFLLLVSLVLEAGLTVVGNFAIGPDVDHQSVWKTGNFIISLAVITGLFAMILKVLPDVRLAWRDVWVGALLTALLFNFGKFLIGYYLGRSSLVSIYGAAGSLIVLLMWIYYSTQIVFFGAQFTRLYAQRRRSQSRSRI
jgi:membrane protein